MTPPDTIAALCLSLACGIILLACLVLWVGGER